MKKDNEAYKKKAQEHLEKVKKEASQKIKEAEEKAQKEKRKAEDVIKQATKMIIEARSNKKSKSGNQTKMLMQINSPVKLKHDNKGSPYPDHDANWDFVHHPWPQELDTHDLGNYGSDPQWWGSPYYFNHQKM